MELDNRGKHGLPKSETRLRLAWPWFRTTTLRLCTGEWLRPLLAFPLVTLPLWSVNSRDDSQRNTAKRPGDKRRRGDDCDTVLLLLLLLEPYKGRLERTNGAGCEMVAVVGKDCSRIL